MKRSRNRPVIALALLVTAGVALLATPQSNQQSVTELLPAGPLLVLEARDFASLVGGWNASLEKQLWLAGENYQAFSRSKLFLRLKDAQEEFATAAGVPPDMNLVESVAGGESALGLYGIGRLEFLYITRLRSARAMESVLWNLRGSFEPREAAGLAYYVRTDEKEKRTVGFAATGDYLLLATREDLLAGALTRLAGDSGESVTGEPWYQYPVRAADRPGDLRLVMNFEAVKKTPHFISYWVQRNHASLKKLKAVLSDLHIEPREIREERVLLSEMSEDALNEKLSSEPHDAAVADLLRLVPDETILYQALAAPIGEGTVKFLTKKILGLDPRTSRSTSISARSSTDDLEIRIDQPPTVVHTGGFAAEEFSPLFERENVWASLRLQSSRKVDGGVFVRHDSALVLRGKSPWDAAAVCHAFVRSIETLWTASKLGMQCRKQTTGGYEYLELDGLKRIAVAVRGEYLVIANHRDLIPAVFNRFSAPAPPSQGYLVAGFRHSRERDYFSQMMEVLDHPWRNRSTGRGRIAGSSYADSEQFRRMLQQMQSTGNYDPQALERIKQMLQQTRKVQSAQASPQSREQAAPPQFFSDNIESLSDTLSRVESVTFVSRAINPAWERQTVTYHLRP